MKETILMVQGERITEIPRKDWEEGLAAAPGHVAAGLAFMTGEHHRVRNFVVRELPRAGSALTPEFIAGALNLAMAQVRAILDDLEKHMTFLFRNEEGAVSWAYPVTVDSTPHRITFGTGESLFAAWAIDAIATPFVQGRLRGEPLAVTVESSCALCGDPLVFEMDSDLEYSILSGGPEPMLFHPFVDFATLPEPSIINAF